MKKALILLVISFAMFNAVAQKKQNTYFVKNNGKEVKLRDSADFIRIIEEPDSGETFFNIKEYYLDGTKKLIGKLSSFEPKLIYEGTFISFYKNGMKKSAINYKKDNRVGMAFYFFENGKVKRQLEYLEEELGDKKAGNSIDPKSKLIYQVDSLGKVYVQEGNGHLIDTSKSEKDKFIEEGDYKDGFKDGVWRGKYLSGKSSYTETYTAGKFVSGVNTVGDNTIEYKVLESAPQFKGGINEFYKYLSRAIKYPKEAYTNGIGGSVLLNFVIEKDGQVADVKIDKPVFPSIDEEAMRVMMASPKWVPGIQRGVPVRVKYNIPIKFSVR